MEIGLCGSGGAGPEVVNFSGSCHKHFQMLKQAEDFIADWEEMYSCVVKDKIKRELSEGYRPKTMRGTPVEFTLETECSDEDKDLVDSFRRVMIRWKL